jgi:MtrB/PioB family decaheme-associated outer membrane protein
MPMRTRLLIGIATLLLCSRIGMAQTPAKPPPQAPAPPAAIVPSLGSIDFGFRGTGTDVDEARYERYRDLRTGAASRFQVGKETPTYWVDAKAFNIGYRDQRYVLDYDRSKVDFSFLWDSIPTNFSYLTVSAWTVGDDGVLTISPALRQQVQNRTAVGVPCAPGGPPAACNNPTNVALALANRSIYNVNSTGFDIQSRRDTAAFGLTYEATSNLDLHFNFATIGKSGHQPWGASFAFNNANEVPLPLDNRTNDISAGVEWASHKAMLRLGWDASFFDNRIQTLTWDNPIFATDFNNGRTPPDGPYDPSGYSNGNGPAQGRMALPPSNNMNVISAMGLYKLTRRTTVNGTLQFTRQNQNEALIPWTINPLIDQPSVHAVFPHLASLPRRTAEAEIQGVNALLNFNSRPFRNLGFTVRYRYNDRDNETPAFDATEYVRFDAVPEEIEEGISQQYDTTRHTFDANASYSFNRLGSLRIGFGHDGWHRRGRGFSDVGDNTFRASYDVFGNQYFTVRAGFDQSWRRGDGFILTGIDYEEGPGGTQPSLRYYDEADRDRTRGSLTLSVMPTEQFDVNVTYSGGKDKYLADEFTPGREQFGLLDADTHAVTLAANYFPTAQTALGITYGYETSAAFQRSRNANPPPDPSWTDPTRDWTLDNDEHVNTVTIYADLLKVFKRTDLRVAYDYMDSDNAFVHGGPRIQQISFIPLPNITTSWNRFRADLNYFFDARVGLGVGYLFENLKVKDFATIDGNGSVGFTAPTDSVRIDYLGGLITGYNARPYTGNTAFVRLLYLF